MALDYSPPDMAKLARAIRQAVRLLESGKINDARNLLRATLPCPPPEHDLLDLEPRTWR